MNLLRPRVPAQQNPHWYCDKELAESNAKKADKSDEVVKLSTYVEQLSSVPAQLNKEVARWQSELSKLAKAQHRIDGHTDKLVRAWIDELRDQFAFCQGVVRALIKQTVGHMIDARLHVD